MPRERQTASPTRARPRAPDGPYADSPSDAYTEIADELQLELVDLLGPDAGRFRHLFRHADDGLLWTILTALAAWTVAFVLGSLVGIMRTLPSQALLAIGNAYIELFRNVPLLVQLFIWFFVVPELLPHAVGTWIKQLSYGPFYTAVVGIGLYMSSRVATQVTAGIRSLPSRSEDGGDRHRPHDGAEPTASCCCRSPTASSSRR